MLLQQSLDVVKVGMTTQMFVNLINHCSSMTPTHVTFTDKTCTKASGTVGMSIYVVEIFVVKYIGDGMKLFTMYR